MSRKTVFHNFDPYRPMQLLLQLLPQDMKWTADERRRWLAAIEANVDYLVEVRPTP